MEIATPEQQAEKQISELQAQMREKAGLSEHFEPTIPDEIDN